MFISNLAFLDVVSQETEVSGGGRRSPNCNSNGGHGPKKCKPICLSAFKGFADAGADASASGYNTLAVTYAFSDVTMNDDNTTGSSTSGSYATSSVGYDI